jgi:hypothetical protein
MKEVSGYNISEKEFKKISKWARNVYNIATIVDYCLVARIKRARSRFSSLLAINFVRTQPKL